MDTVVKAGALPVMGVWHRHTQQVAASSPIRHPASAVSWSTLSENKTNKITINPRFIESFIPPRRGRFNDYLMNLVLPFKELFGSAIVMAGTFRRSNY